LFEAAERAVRHRGMRINVRRIGNAWLRLLAALLTFGVTCWASPASAKRVAFVVGINSYDNLKPDQQLNKAVNDAQAIGTTLKDVGFQVIAAENTTRTAFLRTWQRFLNSVEPGDVATVFFAGHGIEVGGVNYILTSDVPKAEDGEEVLRGSAIRVSSLMERLREQNPQVSLWIIDACRDSPYAGKGVTRSVGSTRGLKREEPPKGTLVMMSAGTGQGALDALSPSDAHPNSVYTRTLLPLLKEPGLEITELAKRVRGQVESLAATINHDQRPAFYHELSGNFFLTPQDGGASAAAPAPGGMSEAAQAWMTVKDSNNPALLEAFTQQFGSTFYGRLAQSRLDDLKKGSKTQTALASPPPAAKELSSPAQPRSQPPLPSAAAPSTPSPPGSTYAPTSASPAAPPASSNRPASTPSAAPRKPPTAMESAQAWLSVKDSTDPAALEEFLSRHAQSIYVDQARAKLAELQQRAKPRSGTDLALVSPPGGTKAPPVTTPAVGIFEQKEKTPLSSAQERSLRPKNTFAECNDCPEMIVIPAGRFTIGSPSEEPGRSGAEGPQRPVEIRAAFAVGKFAVTFAEWDACVAAGGCNRYKPADDGGRRGRHPVVNVSWEDANAYVTWLSKLTGKTYRLLTEAEREYVARAGTTSPYWFGASITSKRANYDAGYTEPPSGEFRQKTVPVDFFDANPFGVYQVHGNVQEWVQDCWSPDHQTTPADGSAWVPGQCPGRVLRGGSWFDAEHSLRSAARIGFFQGYRGARIGFRVARSL
jgi:formylglycine-generating enzyme required for sulfatase activity